MGLNILSIYFESKPESLGKLLEELGFEFVKGFKPGELCAVEFLKYKKTLSGIDDEAVIHFSRYINASIVGDAGDSELLGERYDDFVAHCNISYAVDAPRFMVNEAYKVARKIKHTYNGYALDDDDNPF